MRKGNRQPYQHGQPCADTRPRTGELDARTRRYVPFSPPLGFPAIADVVPLVPCPQEDERRSPLPWRGVCGSCRCSISSVASACSLVRSISGRVFAMLAVSRQVARSIERKPTIGSRARYRESGFRAGQQSQKTIPKGVGAAVERGIGGPEGGLASRPPRIFLARGPAQPSQIGRGTPAKWLFWLVRSSPSVSVYPDRRRRATVAAVMVHSQGLFCGTRALSGC
jgi:hypothetical protein